MASHRKPNLSINAFKKSGFGFNNKSRDNSFKTAFICVPSVLGNPDSTTFSITDPQMFSSRAENISPILAPADLTKGAWWSLRVGMGSVSTTFNDTTVPSFSGALLCARTVRPLIKSSAVWDVSALMTLPLIISFFKSASGILDFASEGKVIFRFGNEREPASIKIHPLYDPLGLFLFRSKTSSTSSLGIASVSAISSGVQSSCAKFIIFF